MISQMRLKCPHAEGVQGTGAAEAGPRAAKHAKLEPAASMTAEVLKNELRQRGLDSTGNMPEMAARLEESRKQGAGCRYHSRHLHVAVRHPLPPPLTSGCRVQGWKQQRTPLPPPLSRLP